jgi:hypothetical protein
MTATPSLYVRHDGYIGSCLLCIEQYRFHICFYIVFWEIVTLEYQNIFPINLPIILETLQVSICTLWEYSIEKKMGDIFIDRF